jgi:hypothetical protein
MKVSVDALLSVILDIEFNQALEQQRSNHSLCACGHRFDGQRLSALERAFKSIADHFDLTDLIASQGFSRFLGHDEFAFKVAASECCGDLKFSLNW